MISLSYRLIISIVGFILVFSILLYQYYHITIDKLKYQNKEYAAQIELLKSESEDQLKRFQIAQKISQDDINAFKNKSNDIMNQPVSHDCKKAIDWGILKAKDLN